METAIIIIVICLVCLGVCARSAHVSLMVAKERLRRLELESLTYATKKDIPAKFISLAGKVSTDEPYANAKNNVPNPKIGTINYELQKALESNKSLSSQLSEVSHTLQEKKNQVYDMEKQITFLKGHGDTVYMPEISNLKSVLAAKEEVIDTLNKIIRSHERVLAFERARFKGPASGEWNVGLSIDREDYENIRDLNNYNPVYTEPAFAQESDEIKGFELKPELLQSEPFYTGLDLGAPEGDKSEPLDERDSEIHELDCLKCKGSGRIKVESPSVKGTQF